jgi:hypothetical protein
MKLSKDELEDLLNARKEWLLDNAEFLRSQGLSGKKNDDSYERYEALLNKLEDGTLEIEGYERSEWVKLNPDDKSTFPTAGQRVLIWCEGEVCIAYAYIDDVPGQDPCCVFATPKLSWHGEVTHWRPLPQPPKAKEK